MNKEIEIKARVDDPYKLKQNIENLCNATGIPFKKNDQYFFYNLPDKTQKQNVRLRLEGNLNIVTIKKKAIDSNIEVNDEIEFTVSSGEDFIDFLFLSGAEKMITKSKKGWKFHFEQKEKKVLIELCEVSKLGWFIEIEIILTNPNQAEIEDAKFVLKEVLNFLNIPKDKIECRYYSDLLREIKTIK